YRTNPSTHGNQDEDRPAQAGEDYARSRDAAALLSNDGGCAPDGRPGDPAQAAEQDLLPDLGRRPRGRAGCPRGASAPRLRLVLPLLPRPRTHAGARYDTLRAPAPGGCSGGRPVERWAADAGALGEAGAPDHEHVVADGHAVPPGGRRSRGRDARDPRR